MRYGSEDSLTHNAIMHLFDVYVGVNWDAAMEKENGGLETTNQEAREVFRKMESGAYGY